MTDRRQVNYYDVTYNLQILEYDVIILSISPEAPHIMLFVAIILCTLSCCDSTKDLNLQELRLVAEHLRYEDCMRLISSLHRKEFFIKKEEIVPEQSNKTCLYLLLRWDRTEGKGTTFNDLPLRLRQLGHISLADKLSRIVYHEKAYNLQRTFLDDPYKKMIPKNSYLLDNDEVRREVHPKAEDSSSDVTAVFWLVCGMVFFLILLRILFRAFCPGACVGFCRRTAPQPVIEGCDFCCGEMNRFAVRFKKHFRRYVIGIHMEDKVLDEEI